MIFSRHVQPSCSYCRYGRPIGVGEIACVKRGITTPGSSCVKFTYDPLKREPDRAPALDKKKYAEQLSSGDMDL